MNGKEAPIIKRRVMKNRLRKAKVIKKGVVLNGIIRVYKSASGHWRNWFDYNKKYLDDELQFID